MSKIIWKFHDILKNGCRRHFHSFKKSAGDALAPITINAFKPNSHNFRILTVLALFWPLGKSKTQTLESDENEAKKMSQEVVKQINDADHLFDSGQYDEAHKLLEDLNNVNEDNPEIKWRIGRVLYQIARQKTEKNKKALIERAYNMLFRALELDERNFACHKWIAVVSDQLAACNSTTERIKNLSNVKRHMLRAIEINPNDATTQYMMGEWCYRVADISYIERKIAEVLFSTPPNSSFSEALEFFQKAEQIEPRFYSMNLLMLGKAHYKLGNMQSAHYYLNLALHYPARSNDDHEANKMAQEALKLLPKQKRDDY